MSDYWGDICPKDQPTKKINENEMAMLECRRKSSVISNLSNDDTGIMYMYLDIKGTKNQLDPDHNDGLMERDENELDKFLFSTRVTALKLIREEEI
jgi:hypothetical protein